MYKCVTPAYKHSDMYARIKKFQAFQSDWFYYVFSFEASWHMAMYKIQSDGSGTAKGCIAPQRLIIMEVISNMEQCGISVMTIKGWMIVVLVAL